MRKFLASLVFVIPLLICMAVTVDWNLYDESDEMKMSQGKCLETFQVEHYFKNTAPTKTTHSVVRIDENVYIVDGSCVKHDLPKWTDIHNAFVIFLGCVGFIGWLALFLLTLITIAWAWWALFRAIWDDDDRQLSFFDKWLEHFIFW